MKEIILKHSLINAIEHKGKAELQAVLKRVLAENPEMKSRIREIIEEVKKCIEEVNSLSVEEQKRKLDELGVKIEKKKREGIRLPELEEAEVGKVITVFPPEPSKFPHIGHAKAAYLNFLYAKQYNGKFIIRFEDTNPRMVKKIYYKAILDGLKWLGIEFDVIDYSSDYMEKFYEAVEKLLEENKAYVCLCKKEEIKRKRAIGEECEHRNNEIGKNLELWKKMKNEFEEGEATIRLKIDMKSLNMTLRDPSVMRIIDSKHPRVGKRYRVWPMYDFATALMDGWEGVTHRLRSKEFEIRKELQHFIQNCFGFKPTHIIEFGRLNLEGVLSSGRKIREMIKNKELIGWDDPRLTTLIALKKRGFDAQAIKNFILLTGVSKAEGVLSWEMLEAENRKVIDPKSNRYMVVLDPVCVSIEGGPEIKEVKVALHPDFPKRGFRLVPVNMKKIYLERSDYEKYKNKIVGLMYLATVKINEKISFVSREIPFEIPKIHWCSEPNLKIKMVMPNAEVKEVICEPEIKNVKNGETIQMPRVGFAKVGKKYKDIVLYYTHK